MVMLIIQTPGTWIWLIYLMASGENWSTWLSTFVAAVQVTILLGQVIYYDYVVSFIRKRKHQQHEKELKSSINHGESDSETLKYD